MHDLSVCAISVEQASVTLEADPGWARLRCSVRVDLPTDFPRVQGTAQVMLLTRDGEIVGAVSGTGMRRRRSISVSLNYDFPSFPRRPTSRLAFSLFSSWLRRDSVRPWCIPCPSPARGHAWNFPRNP